jgi:hypothetical protein
VRRTDVPLERELRQRIRAERYRWPFELLPESRGQLLVVYLDRPWRLVSLEGVSAAELSSARFGPGNLYDGVCELTGRSPGARVDFVLEDLVGGARTEFRAVPRDGEPVLAEHTGE